MIIFNNNNKNKKDSSPRWFHSSRGHDHPTERTRLVLDAGSRRPHGHGHDLSHLVARPRHLALVQHRQRRSARSPALVPNRKCKSKNPILFYLYTKFMTLNVGVFLDYWSWCFLVHLVGDHVDILCGSRRRRSHLRSALLEFVGLVVHVAF